jgi:hypothetical protein
MKQLLYYVILAAIFIALDLVICFSCAFANIEPGRIIFNSLLIGAVMITGLLSSYVKKWLKIEDKTDSEDKPQKE